MSISFDCRSLALLLLMTACLVCTPGESCCQTILQPTQLPMATPTPQVDEKSEAETKLRIVSAVLTKTPDGRVVGFQMAEGLWPGEPTWPYLFKLTDLQDLDLSAMNLSNRHLKDIGKLTELRNLNLFGNVIDSVAMSYLTGLQKLETLYLYRTFVDDKGLESIAKLKKLKRLNLFDTLLTDKGLKTLGTCKQLTHLSLGNTKAGDFPKATFTPEAIEQLRSDLPNTEITFWGSKDDELDLPKLLGDFERGKSSDRRKLSVVTSVVAKAPDLAKRKGLDWPCFLGTNGDGKSAGTGLNTDWNASPPPLVWHKPAGTGFAAPSISKGRLMLYQRVRNEGGKQRFSERLSCLHSETGEELWEVDFSTSFQDLGGYGDGPRSTPVIDGDRVFILSPEGMLRCLQCVDGKQVWEVDLRADYDCDLINYGVGTTPVVFGDNLLVIAGGKLPEGKEATVVAIDKKTGIFQYGVGKGAASYATPLVRKSQGRLWCFAFTRDGLLAFNPETGKKDFEFPWRSNIAGCVNAATPVVEGDRVLISESYSRGSAQLQFSDGGMSSAWQDSRKVREKLLMHWATPIFHEGFVYGCSGRHSANGELKCVDWTSGRTVWKHKLADRTSLTYFDGHFLNLGENGVLTLLKVSPHGYQEVGRLNQYNTKLTPSYPAWGAPVIARGMLYLRGKHEIICYDLSKAVNGNGGQDAVHGTFLSE